MQYLSLNLAAPVMSFGAVRIDAYGMTHEHPTPTMVVGLLANALGLTRLEGDAHQELQDRLVLASRIDRGQSGQLTDYQSSNLGRKDVGWTTRGEPEGRGGSPDTYSGTIPRYRDYLQDWRVTAAIRLEDADLSPTLEDVAQALRYPARPLFIGRKPCLPTALICGQMVEAESALDAVLQTGLPPGADQHIRVFWPEGEGVPHIVAERSHRIANTRAWSGSRVHGGNGLVLEATVPSDWFPPQVDDD